MIQPFADVSCKKVVLSLLTYLIFRLNKSLAGADILCIVEHPANDIADRRIPAAVDHLVGFKAPSNECSS